MGDINCDFRDENAEVRAWELELDRSGFTPLDQQGAWGDVATRVPQGAQRGRSRQLDVVLASGPAMANAAPEMMAIGSDSQLDTSGFGACPDEYRVGCPDQCKCLQRRHSDHKLLVWGVKGLLKPPKNKRPVLYKSPHLSDMGLIII